jgi:thiamine pyrophosphokinase
MAERRAIIFANGELSDPESARGVLREGGVWIAADGGTRHAFACGRAPDVVIGDLDSLPEPLRGALAAAGTAVRPHPVDKDETDLELAIDFAVREGYRSIRIVGGLGGRTDQTVGTLSLLAEPGRAEFDIRCDDGCEEALSIRGAAALEGRAGDIVSLIPFGLPAEGITTEGLRFPLRGETLEPYKTRGISNRMVSPRAVIRVEKGVLLCIHTRLAAGTGV